ncbi:MAG: hypothetical protein RLZZ230_653 [Candidatus Parcubacteria bacterium]|jgi:hypoxanthine phosphoribosyltransferase
MWKFHTIIRVLQDMRADNTRVLISQQEISVCCVDLALAVQQKYQPDFVVAIDTGGSVPGELIALSMNVPVVHVVIRRNINIVRKYSLDPIPLRWIMSMYHHYLFQTIRPVITKDVSFDMSGKKVLIVDDSLHTGATIDVAVDYLKGINVSEIQIATLSYVSKRKPDFSVLPFGNYSFPWSKDFKKL